MENYFSFLKGIRDKFKSLIVSSEVSSFIGFVWQGFGSGGATGVASVRSCRKLPPCLTEPMPAGSKMDPLLDKAEPIINGGSTFGIMYLSWGKSCCATAIAASERSENMCENQLYRHQSQGSRRWRRCSR